MRTVNGALAGSVVGSVLASICCVGPLLLALMGVGGGGALLILAPYRPYLLAGTGLLLGAAFYLTYRRPHGECASGEVCEAPASRRWARAALWIATMFVVLTASFPYWVDFLF